MNDQPPHDPHDHEAARRDATSSWVQEQITRRLAEFRTRRPAVFAAPGELHPQIVAWVARFAAGDRGGLIVTGPTGVGKTWTLWKIGETLLQRGFWGTIEIKSPFEVRRIVTPPVNDAAIDRLASAGLLMLDDFGSARVSSWDSDNLHAIIDPRWAQQRPTVMTSNLADLRAALGERVASRLADKVTVVEMRGTDRRRAS